MWRTVMYMSDATLRNDKSGTLLLSMMLAVTAAVVLVLGALGARFTIFCRHHQRGAR